MVLSILCYGSDAPQSPLLLCYWSDTTRRPLYSPLQRQMEKYLAASILFYVTVLHGEILRGLHCTLLLCYMERYPTASIVLSVTVLHGVIPAASIVLSVTVIHGVIPRGTRCTLCYCVTWSDTRGIHCTLCYCVTWSDTPRHPLYSLLLCYMERYPAASIVLNVPVSLGIVQGVTQEINVSGPGVSNVTSQTSFLTKCSSRIPVQLQDKL